MLLCLSGDVGQQRQGVGGRCDLDSVFQEVPTGEFKGGEDLPGLGKPDSGDGKQMVERETGLVLADQSGHLPCNSANIYTGSPHTEDSCNQFLVRQCGRPALLEFFARPAMRWHVFNSFHSAIEFLLSRNDCGIYCGIIPHFTNIQAIMAL